MALQPASLTEICMALMEESTAAACLLSMQLIFFTTPEDQELFTDLLSALTSAQSASIYPVNSGLLLAVGFILSQWGP